MDWALIESWKEMEVPLHIALRGIEKSFDSWESKPRKRTVKSLLYCQEEVEAQYAEWLEARVGASDADENGSAPSSDAQPFSRAAVTAHIGRVRGELETALKRRAQAGEDDLTESLQRVLGLLTDLESELTVKATFEAQKLEQSLTGLERLLSDALRSVVDREQLAILKSEVAEQLKPYRKHMEAAVYEQTLDNLLMKRLREVFGIPRLSLFYL